MLILFMVMFMVMHPDLHVDVHVAGQLEAEQAHESERNAQFRLMLA